MAFLAYHLRAFVCLYLVIFETITQCAYSSLGCTPWKTRVKGVQDLCVPSTKDATETAIKTKVVSPKKT